MQPNHFLKAGLLAVVLVLSFILCWEIFLRQKGYSVSYDDGGPLWSNQRAQVYLPSNEATVFIGSSRIKFDLDIPTWEKLTGERAVQLAMVGSSPLPALHNLANDKNFKGKLVVDVTEGLFFSTSKGNLAMPEKNIEYYKNQTPTQKASFQLNHLAESQFVFLDKDFLSLNTFLDSLHFKNRGDIYGGPDFPWEFDLNMFNRQSKMTDRFVSDTNLQNKVKSIWGGFAKRNKGKPPTGKTLDSIMLAVKASVDKIKARGGQVIFVRTPSSGPYWQAEQMGFPRPVYWDKLLAVTQCPGIHFKDYPAIAHFICPELSHLSPKDAIVFTEHFVGILREKGWNFSSKQLALTSAHPQN
jgi:hypothetical protein